MAYDPNIPQPTDDLSDSQVSLLANFQQLDTSFGINHYAYSDASSSNGKHKKVDFPAVTTIVAPVGAASVIWPKDVTGVSSPFFSNSVGDSVLWRGGSTNGLVVETISTNGRLNLPDGFRMKWGQGNFSGTGTTGTVTYAQQFTSTTFSVIVTPFGGSGAIVRITAQSATAFTVTRSGDSTNNLLFNWIAIGD